MNGWNNVYFSQNDQINAIDIHGYTTHTFIVLFGFIINIFDSKSVLYVYYVLISQV